MKFFMLKARRFRQLIFVFLPTMLATSDSLAQIDYEDLPYYPSQEWYAKYNQYMFGYCMTKNSLSQSLDQLKACADGEVLKAKKVHYMEIPKGVREKIDRGCTSSLARENSTILGFQDPKAIEAARLRALANAWICIRDGHIAAFNATLPQTNHPPSRGSEQIEKEQKPSVEKKTHRNEGIELSR